MKKFCAVLVALLMVTMLASTAFATSLSVWVDDSGAIRYSASDFEGKLTVLLDGAKFDSLIPGNASGKVTADPGYHEITIMPDGITKGVTVPGASEPEETPTPTPELPEETPTPTPQLPEETPTPTPELPEETPTPTPEEPEQTPTPTPVEPENTTPAPAEDDDDEVPKTGDSATASFLMGGAMVLAAAYLLLRRRVHSK